MFKSKIARTALVSMCLVLTSGLAVAQDNTITFDNPGMPPLAIELLNDTSVGIDGDGNLTAKCVPNLAGDACEGIDTSPSGDVPAITLQRTGSTGNINSGGTLALAWTVDTAAADVCAASSSPAVTGWNGNIVSKTSASANLTMTAAGTFTLTLKCYNQFGVSNTGSVSVTVTGTTQPPTNVPACTIDGIADGKQFVQPDGFNGHMVTWEQLLSGASFPNGKPYLSPTGSYTLRNLSPQNQGPVMSSRFFSTEIIPQPNKNYKLSWVNVQRQVSVPGYTSARGAHNVFISISRCAGDLRPREASSTDPSLKSCRAFSPSSQLTFGTTGATGQCPLEAGVKYYITFAFVDPSDGLDPTEHTCIPAAGRCEVNLNAL